MAWTGKAERELSVKEMEMARIAGIPADRENLGGEYPKAVYQEASEDDAPKLYDKPFKIDGKLLRMATVNDPIEEQEAIAQGWYLTTNLEAEQKKRDALAEKDEEIARLQAELAKSDNKKTLTPKYKEEA